METDLYTEHSFNLYRYGTYASNQALNLLGKIDDRLIADLHKILDGLTDKEIGLLLRNDFKTRRLVALVESVKKMAHDTRMATSSVITINGKELSAYEIGFTERALGGSTVPAGEAVTAPAVHAAAKSRPMIGRHVRDWVADLEPALRKQIFDQIRDGYATSETDRQIVNRIKGTAAQKFKDGILAKKDNRIASIVRTSMNHISNQANRAAMEANGVKLVRWSAQLDGRTSKICASRDGMIKPIAKMPDPPAHPNCRSVLVSADDGVHGRRPFVESDKAMAKISKADRKDLVGQVNASTSYEQWFKGRSAKFQRKWLGKSRYELYKNGDFTIDRFVDPRTGYQYNLDALRAQDAHAFKAAGL